jgi:hypothetical protein
MPRFIYEKSRSVITTKRLAAETRAALDPNSASYPKQISVNRLLQEAFDKIVTEFPKSYLTDHQRDYVAHLARLMVLIEFEQLTLEKEGTLTTSGKISPRFRVLNNLFTLVSQMRRNLGLSLELLGGGSRKRGEGTSAREADAAQADNFDDLIARPGNHQAP